MNCTQMFSSWSMLHGGTRLCDVSIDDWPAIFWYEQGWFNYSLLFLKAMIQLYRCINCFSPSFPFSFNKTNACLHWEITVLIFDLASIDKKYFYYLNHHHHHHHHCSSPPSARVQCSISRWARGRSTGSSLETNVYLS